MDALVAAIAQILDYIQSQGPGAIEQLMGLLVALKVGVVSVTALFHLAAESSAITAIISQLIALISSGAGVTEIATAMGSLAGSLGLSLDALIHILQMIFTVLVAF